MKRMVTGQCKGILLTGALGLILGLGACGDDGGDGATPDGGGNADGATDAESDARPDPNMFRSGTVSILDMQLTNPGLEASGATISITYRDVTVEDVTPIGDPGELGACAVFVYNVGADPDPDANREDEGAVTVSIERPSPFEATCSFDAAANRYRCPVNTGTVANNSVISPSTGGNGNVSITFTNDPAPFVGLDVVGTFIEIDGFTEPAYNGRFPVVAQTEANIITIRNPNAPPGVLLVDEATAPTFTVYAGEGPTPANRDFLGLSKDEISLSKADGAFVPPIDATMQPAGANLSLVNGTARPHEFPTTAQDLTFSCDPTDAAGGGNCGPAAGVIYGWVINGRTTDAPLAGLGPTDMPPAVNQFATFQCRGTPLQPTITMAQEFVDAVLGTSPTRIETNLFRISADLTNPATSIVAGHGMVGYTDIQ